MLGCQFVFAKCTEMLQVHCDQSKKGALRRLKMNIGADESVEDLLKGRVQMIKYVLCYLPALQLTQSSVWRPLNGPVQDWPLATMDYQSAKATEILPCDLLKDTFEERGQTATFTYSKQQKWYYLDKQRTDEVTVVKIWDSKNDGTSNCRCLRTRACLDLLTGFSLCTCCIPSSRCSVRC
jgi:hypothetical protein